MMSELFEKSIRTLELPAVLEMLSAKAVSEAAREKSRHIMPATERQEVLRLLDETDAAKERLGLYGSPSFSGVKDVSEPLARADRGGMLNTRELLNIAGLLTAARRVYEYDEERKGEATAIDRFFSALHTNKYLEDRIHGAILDEETIADTASAELTDIRRKMRIAASKGRQILQKIISSPSYAKVLQEALITQRDGRFVVPVKAECKGSLPGLVHDISSSGATLFVEPMGVVQANNELKELEAREEKEIERILRELSAQCADAMEYILLDYDMLVHLDMIFARAQLSYTMNASRPEVVRKGAISLKRARHPLLDQAKAVPVTVELGGDYDTLVITGPNTGGKTVTLKTLGLLCLMAQCGLHIPADSGSTVRVFDRILADVGDEQSIEQSLSTFSAHMSNTVEILRQADDDSLILFDELGAGTDPVEGAALAIAIIQHARSKGALIAATTHYAELKTFAMTTAGVENASCEFDVQTLRPTYRLLVGIPGKSNAFAISRRLGLDESVIADAKAQMDSESLRFEDVLAQLEEKRQRLEKAQTEANRLWQQREEDARKARIFREQMEKAKENARAKGEAEAKRIVREAQQKTEEIFAQLEELRKQQTRAANFQQVNDAKAAIRHDLKEAEAVLHSRDRGTGSTCAQPPHRRGRSGGAGGGENRRHGAERQRRRLYAAAGRKDENDREGRTGAAAGIRRGDRKAEEAGGCRPAEKRVAANSTGGPRRIGAGHPGHGDAGGRERGGELHRRRRHGQAGHRDHHPRQGYRRAAQGGARDAEAEPGGEVLPAGPLWRGRGRRHGGGAEISRLLADMTVFTLIFFGGR